MMEVRTPAEIDEAARRGEMFVAAVCPKCGKSFSSLIGNARIVVSKGCIVCTMDTADEWIPTPEVVVKVRI